MACTGANRTNPGFNVGEKMSNITTMPQRSGACQNVIERLEEALDMAKKGSIANLMIVMVDTENNVMHRWANGNRPTLMIGDVIGGRLIIERLYDAGLLK